MMQLIHILHYGLRNTRNSCFIHVTQRFIMISHVSSESLVSFLKANYELSLPINELEIGQSFDIPKAHPVTFERLKIYALRHSKQAKRFIVKDWGESLEIGRTADYADTAKFYTIETAETCRDATLNAIDRYKIGTVESLKGYEVVTAEMHDNRIIPYGFLQRRLSQLAVFRKAEGGATAKLKEVIAELIECGELTLISGDGPIRYKMK